MEDSSYLMQLLAAFFYTAASVALFRLSSRTGQRPERLLGFAPLFYGLSYFFYQTWMGMTEMFSVGAVWLAFFPPTLYRSWLGKSAVAEAAGGAE
jgi:hypothetical protein